ncbi:MAG: energy transducer TonB [Myxococcales bacterium]|nr:energy transducer TonB [Myxococcales bacterium]
MPGVPETEPVAQPQAPEAVNEERPCASCCSASHAATGALEEPEGDVEGEAPCLVAPGLAAAEPSAAEPSSSRAAPGGSQAFSVFLEASRGGRPSRRSVSCWALAGVLHVAALGYGAAQAMWQVDELSPSKLKVSLLAWSEARPLPPPPPPPPPAAASSPSQPRPSEAEPQPRPALVQPQDEVVVTEPEPTAGASEGGVEGGVEGGAVGGVVGGVLGAPASDAPPAAPPVVALTASEREQLVARYLTDVLDRRLKAHLFYPPEAEEEELEGTVWVSVIIDGRGQLVSAHVVRGAELGVLTRAALQTVHRAQPFPAPPAALGSRVEVRVPLTYRLEG